MSLWRSFDITELGGTVTMVWDTCNNLEMFENACSLVWDVSNQFNSAQTF